MPSPFKSPVTMQAALVTAMGVPVVNGDLALPVPKRHGRPRRCDDGEVGLAIAVEVGCHATACTAGDGGPNAILVSALALAQQHGHGVVRVEHDVRQAIVS